MLGTERLDIEHEFQMLTEGPEVTLQGLDGACIEGEDRPARAVIAGRF